MQPALQDSTIAGLPRAARCPSRTPFRRRLRRLSSAPDKQLSRQAQLAVLMPLWCGNAEPLVARDPRRYVVMVWGYLLDAATINLILRPLAVKTKEFKRTILTTVLLACTLSATSQTIPPESIFEPPAPNSCNSPYDQFYINEPGVYIDWALCESGNRRQFYDYAGAFDLTSADHSFGYGLIEGGIGGPLPDEETAAHVSTAGPFVAIQGVPINPGEGSLALWIKADPTPRPVTALLIKPPGSNPFSVSLGLAPSPNGSEGNERPVCFEAGYSASTDPPLSLKRCGYLATEWYRLVLTWNSDRLVFYVDATPIATAQIGSVLPNTLYRFRLFPGCCNTGRSMSLARVLVANRAWSAAQVRRDFRPEPARVPPGGVLITTQHLGTIHRDILGVADSGQDLSTPERRAALRAGLRAAGITSVRYAGGYGGIQADLVDWKTGATCPPLPGRPGAPHHAFINDGLDHFAEAVLRPLHLDVVYTVNYGTNPPACDGGGQPASAAALVRYVDDRKHLGIHDWEIGNEIPSSSTETDFHPDPNTGLSYIRYEPDFYRAIHEADPGARVAVPLGVATYGWQADFDLPVLSHALYDDVVWHNYPVMDPVSDGSTLYYDRVTSHVHRVRGALLKLQTELLSHGRAPDAIWVTEWNGEPGGNRWSRQTTGAVAPLFVASQLGEYMRAGVRLATWWTQGYAAICSSLNYDPSGDMTYSWYHCGATALVYTGPVPAHGEVQTGLRPGDLLPAGRAFQLLAESGMVHEGEHSLRTLTDSARAPWLLAFGATHGSGFAVLLINRDRDREHQIPIAIQGMNHGSSVTQWTYGRKQYDLTRQGDWSASPVSSTAGAWNTVYHAHLPPWSVTVLIFK